MPVKSSRFSRMAYARRAALLAEDLAEWYAIYHNRVMANGDLGEWETDIEVLVERDRVLKELVVQLRDISSELVALR